MKVVTLCLVFVPAAVGAVGWAAQDRPNPSGTWIGVGPQHETRKLSVKQDDSTLSLDGGPDYRATFRLDGSETKMSAPDGKSLLVKAAWNGNTLVVTVRDPEMMQEIRRQTCSGGKGRSATVIAGTVNGSRWWRRPPSSRQRCAIVNTTNGMPCVTLKVES